MEDERDNGSDSASDSLLSKAEGTGISTEQSQKLLQLRKQLLHFLSRLRSILYDLVPSFVRPQPARTPSTSTLNLAALDGLRGVACLFVANSHYTSIMTGILNNGYGVDENNRYLVQLPFLTLPFQGDLMVCIFFVISGLVLSIKPLHQIRRRQYEDVLNVLSSTAFRRFLRLYLPTFMATFGLAIATWAGLFEPGRAARTAYPSSIQGPADAPPRLSLRGQIWGWFTRCENMIRFGDRHEWNGHTWTIPVEFYSSLALFAALLSVARLQFKGRLIILGTLILLCYRWDWRSLLTFYAGAFVADIYLEARGLVSRRVPVLPLHVTPLRLNRWRGQLYAVLLVIGLYFSSVPDGSLETPFFSWMSPYTPSSWGHPSSFWRTTGAILVVTVVAFWDDLGFFTLPVVQYFGKVRLYSESLAPSIILTALF